MSSWALLLFHKGSFRQKVLKYGTPKPSFAARSPLFELPGPGFHKNRVPEAAAVPAMADDGEGAAPLIPQLVTKRVVDEVELRITHAEEVGPNEGFPFVV